MTPQTATDILTHAGREALIAQLTMPGPLQPIRDLRDALGCEPSKSPNKVYLARGIADAIEAKLAQMDPEPAPAPSANHPAPPPPAAAETQGAIKGGGPDNPPAAAGDLTPEALAQQLGLSEADRDFAASFAAGEVAPKNINVPQLQVAYLIAVGRPTGSSDKRYLVWKIREARKGKVPVGPIAATGSAGSAGTQAVIPVRMDSGALEDLDVAWASMGFKSRTAFLRHAIAFTLSHTPSGIPPSMSGWHAA